MSVPAKQTLVPFRRAHQHHGFPGARTLIGRSSLLTRTTALLDSGRRLITLLGPPGIGKTCLSTWVAQRQLNRRAAWFCDLSHVTDAAELEVAVLTALKVGGGTAVEALIEKSPLLLVLDNFEQLVAHAPRLLDWLDATSEAALLVTSRERLAIDGECVVELGPLSLVRTDSKDGAVSEAVQLFLARAEDASGHGLDDLPAIEDTVEQLDGIPLAIELAAARTRVMPPAALARRLREGAQVLALAKRGPPRHATLAKAIAWSWALLDEAEKQLLACCSQFAGSFTTDAAEAVLCLTAKTNPEAVVETLASLRDKSLVHVVAPDRLGLYRSIREYAAQRLQQDYPSLRAELAERFIAFYAHLAGAYSHVRVLAKSAAEVRLRPDVVRESSNMNAALALIDSTPHQPRWTQRAQLTSALAFLGRATQKRTETLLEGLLQQADAIDSSLAPILRLAYHRMMLAEGQLASGFAQLRAVYEGPDTSPLSLKPTALLMAGVQKRQEGDTLAALAFHDRVHTIALAHTMPIVHAVNLACRGRLACDLRKDEETNRLNQEAIVLHERRGERWMAGLALANLAQREQEYGHFEKAEHMLQRAIDRFRAAGRHDYESIYASVCGGLYLEWGKYDLARRWFCSTIPPHDAASMAVPRILMLGGHAILEAFTGNAAGAAEQLDGASLAAARSECDLTRVLVAHYRIATDIQLGRADQRQIQDQRRWLQTLDTSEAIDARITRNNVDARFAARLIGLAIQHVAPALVLRVETDGTGFELCGQTAVDLSRRGALRRILHALVKEHARGGALSGRQLFECGWPEQNIQVDAAATRVRVAIASLRKMGLREVLLTRDNGYLLRSDIVIESR